jgi:hypothetical protein
VVGHLVLTLTEGHSLSQLGAAYRTSFITDAIAVAIIVGPWLLTALSSRARLALATLIFFLDWWAILQWHPASFAAIAVKRYAVGILSLSAEGSAPVFPVIPWMAVYLAATVLGERLGAMYAADKQIQGERLLARVGIVVFIPAALLQGSVMMIRRADVTRSALDPRLSSFFSIYEKFPPGLVYLAFFGGAGIVLLALILEADRRALLPGVMNQLRQIGRASLFVFIAQYAFYQAFLARLDLPYTPFWPALFILSVIVLARAAAEWDQLDGNRFLTVGVKALVRRNSAKAAMGQEQIGSARGRNVLARHRHSSALPL